MFKDKEYYVRKTKEAIGLIAMGALVGAFVMLLVFLEVTVM